MPGGDDADVKGYKKMIEALSYDFVQNALIAGMLVSVSIGIIGALVVVNRMVFLAGGIAHSSYGGIGLAIYFGISMALSTSLFAVASALLISWLSIYHKNRIDSFIGLIWAVGMAVGIVMVDLTPGYHGDLMSYLFGSIMAVSSSDIVVMTALLITVFLFVHIWYREILAVSYDSEYASLRGIRSHLFYTLILILSALSVVVAIKVVGLILVIAMMTIPTFIAEKMSKSLYMMMMLSALFAFLFTMVGLVLSYIFDLTSGATIILTSALGMGIYGAVAYLKSFLKS